MEPIFTTESGINCTIRQATENDFDCIISNINSIAEERVHIANEGFKGDFNAKRFKEFIKHSYGIDSIFFVAEINSKIVGDINVNIGRLQKDKHTASFGMGIIKEYRKMGIGSALVEDALKWIKEKGIEKISISVFSSNEAALSLYEKYGFKVEGKRLKQYKINEKYVDEILMAKWL
jgi:ribosomal protein S18 acetylase RimI-like enzyme